MFCAKCGTELLDGAKFCTGCGAAIQGESIPKIEIVQQSEIPAPIQPKESAQKKTEEERKELTRFRVKQAAMIVATIFIGITIITLFDILSPNTRAYNQMCEIIDEYGKNNIFTLYEIERGEPGPGNPDAPYVSVEKKDGVIEVALVENGEDVFRQEYSARNVFYSEPYWARKAIVPYHMDGTENFTVNSGEGHYLNISFVPTGQSTLTDDDVWNHRYDWAVKGLYTGEDSEQEVPVVTQPEPEAPQEAEQPSDSQQSTSSDTTREDFIEKIGSSYWISEGGDVLLVGGSEYGLNVQNISDWEYQEVYFNGYIDDYAESGYNDGHFYIAFYTDPDEYGDSYRVMIRDNEGSDGICVFVGDYRFGTDYEPFYPYE